MAKPEIKVVTRVKTYGKESLHLIHSKQAKNLELAGADLARELRDHVLAVSAGGRSKKALRIRGNPLHPEYEKYRHSKPGEPPRTITGFGKRNVTHRMAPDGRLAVQVGIFKNAIYMIWLEFGVKGLHSFWKIAPRPWLLATFIKRKSRLAKIAATGKAGG